MKPLFIWLLIGNLAAQTVDTMPRVPLSTPQQVYKVSEMLAASGYAAHAGSGCNWRTGLRTGGSACYDDSSVISTYCALGTASNPVQIVFDVSIGIGSAIECPASPYVELDGIGQLSTGIFVLSGSNATAICNKFSGYAAGCQGGVQNLSGSAPSQAGSVIIRDLGINVNRGTYPTGNSNATDARCTNWCMGVAFANLTSLVMDDVEIYDAPTFATDTANIGFQSYTKMTVVSPSHAVNTDCIHMSGPNGPFVVADSNLDCGDDGIAVNAPESFGGNMSGGYVHDVYYNYALTAARVYAHITSGTDYYVGPVFLHHISGTLNGGSGGSVGAPAIVRLGNGSPGATDELQSVSVDGAEFTLTPYNASNYPFDISANVGNLVAANVTWHGPQNASPFFSWTSGAAHVSKLTCLNSTIYLTGTGNAAAAWWGTIANSSSVDTLEMNGCNMVNEHGTTGPTPASYSWDIQSGSSVGTFILTSMNPTTTSLLNGNEWSRITSFYGAGVSSFYHNTTYANLPPATYPGLSVSVSDSNASGVWGATEAGGSAGHYAQLTSDGTNWTVTGK